MKTAFGFNSASPILDEEDEIIYTYDVTANFKDGDTITYNGCPNPHYESGKSYVFETKDSTYSIPIDSVWVIKSQKIEPED